MLYDKKWDTKVEPKLEPWQEHLLAAAQYIRDHGWCQGVMFDESGVCLMGAIASVPGDQMAALVKWKNYMGKKLPAKSAGLWNDKVGRTKEEVIASLEAATKD